MNENLDLCKILEGCEGIELYSPLYGIMTLNSVFDTTFCADVFRLDGRVETKRFLKNGTMTTNYDVSECLIFPSKDQRDWSKFEKPIPIDTPMMCSSYTCVDEFRVAFYAGSINGIHHCFMNGLKRSDSGSTAKWKYMIPFDKFDPNDIKESLKYNIQK